MLWVSACVMVCLFNECVFCVLMCDVVGCLVFGFLFCVHVGVLECVCVFNGCLML